jgi:integrase
MIERVQSGSCNTYMTVFSTVLNYAIENAWIASNPIASVKQLKVTESNVHYPYTTEQRHAILQTALDMGYQQLYLLCQFVYYTLARPYEEIQNLKVGYIKKDNIFLPAQNAKNRKNSAVPIAPSLEAIIQEYKLREYPAEYFVFGKGGEPSQTVQGDIFYNQHLKILRKLELTDFEDRSYTLYGHKHSGAIDLAKKAKDAQHYRMVQFMCRHHSFSQTETYLRKWGFNMQEISKDFLL